MSIARESNNFRSSITNHRHRLPGLHRSYLPIADAGYRMSHENTAELKKLTLATLAFQTEEEEDEDMKMSHEKKKLRVYICFLKYEGGSNFKRVIHLLYIILSNLDFNQKYNII